MENICYVFDDNRNIQIKFYRHRLRIILLIKRSGKGGPLASFITPNS